MRDTLRVAVLKCGVLFAVVGGANSHVLAQHDDPFGGPGADPPQKIDPELYPIKAVSYLEKHLANWGDHTSDATVLDQSLSLLHFELLNPPWSSRHVVTNFGQFASHPWRFDEMRESPSTTVARLRRELVTEREAVHGACGSVMDDRFFRERFQSATKDPWPLDWTQDEKRYTSFAATFFQSLRDDDPADAWCAMAKTDPRNASLYAAAYVGVLRGRTAPPDRELINLFVSGASAHGDLRADERLRRIAMALVSVAQPQDDHTFVRTRLRETLLSALTDVGAYSYNAMLPELGEVYRKCGWDESQPLVDALLNHRSSDEFMSFCQAAKISARRPMNTSSSSDWRSTPFEERLSNWLKF